MLLNLFSVAHPLLAMDPTRKSGDLFSQCNCLETIKFSEDNFWIMDGACVLISSQHKDPYLLKTCASPIHAIPL